MTQLVLIRGLPGSGKTTLANRFMETFLQNCSHYEADMFFEKEGEYRFDRTKLREAHAWCQEQTDEDLNRGFAVVVSNTFTTKKELRPYFALAQKYCITPNVILCQGDWGSIHNVPTETLEAMKIRFEYDIQKLYKDYSW